MTPVPHPFDFFLSKGWDDKGLNVHALIIQDRQRPGENEKNKKRVAKKRTSCEGDTGLDH
jgi:hypothetical protein